MLAEVVRAIEDFRTFIAPVLLLLLLLRVLRFCRICTSGSMHTFLGDFGLGVMHLFHLINAALKGGIPFPEHTTVHGWVERGMPPKRVTDPVLPALFAFVAFVVWVLLLDGAIDLS